LEDNNIKKQKQLIVLLSRYSRLSHEPKREINKTTASFIYRSDSFSLSCGLGTYSEKEKEAKVSKEKRTTCQLIRSLMYGEARS
jgi:hypothetical protein